MIFLINYGRSIEILKFNFPDYFIILFFVTSDMKKKKILKRNAVPFEKIPAKKRRAANPGGSKWRATLTRQVSFCSDL